MRNVNARVPGLVSFLELFTDGRAPDTLAGIITPTVDIERYIRIGKRQRLTNIAPVVANPTGEARLTFENLAPGPNEFWIVDHFTADWDSVASRVAGYASMFPTQGVNPLDIMLGPIGDNGGSGTCSAFASQPFILPPGYVLRGRTTQNPGAASLNGAATVLYTPVRF